VKKICSHLPPTKTAHIVSMISKQYVWCNAFGGRIMQSEFMELLGKIVILEEEAQLNSLQCDLTYDTRSEMCVSDSLESFIAHKSIFFSTLYLIDILKGECFMKDVYIALLITCVSISMKMNYDRYDRSEHQESIINSFKYDGTIINRYTFNLYESEIFLLRRIDYDATIFGICELYKLLRDHIAVLLYICTEKYPEILSINDDFIAIAFVCHSKLSMRYNVVREDFFMCFKSSVIIAFVTIYKYLGYKSHVSKYYLLDFLQKYIIMNESFINLGSMRNFANCVDILSLYSVKSMVNDHMNMRSDHHYIFGALGNALYWIARRKLDQANDMRQMVMIIEKEFEAGRNIFMKEYSHECLRKEFEQISESDPDSPKRSDTTDCYMYLSKKCRIV
jgi:hypothetical protein